MANEYNVAVLGGGPGGYEAAIRCAQYGLKVALIEQGELGGTCLNRGCIPTKALLECAHRYESAKRADAFGVSCGEVGFDYAKMAERRDTVVSKLRKGVEGLEKAYGVTVIRAHGVLTGKNSIDAGGTTVTADSIILATGSSPARPPIPGIGEQGILTSDELLKVDAAPDSLVIIGGGVIGIEFATLFAALDKPVTVLEMLPSILPGVDPDITKLLLRTFKQKGITVRTGAKVLALHGGDKVTVDYELDGESKTAEASCCLVSVGRRPNTEDIGLDSVGIGLQRGFVTVDEHMRTSVGNIYAIGDITGKLQLAHVATAQGMIAAAGCAGHEAAMDYSAIPACVYTEPEVAYVGLTEAAAKEIGHGVKCGVFNVAANGKSMVMGSMAGLVKLVFDDSDGRLLGGQIFAPRATDMIAEIAALIKCGATLNMLCATVHPHPTISEAILEAAHDAEGLCCNAAPKR